MLWNWKFLMVALPESEPTFTCVLRTFQFIPKRFVLHRYNFFLWSHQIYWWGDMYGGSIITLYTFIWIENESIWKLTKSSCPYWSVCWPSTITSSSSSSAPVDDPATTATASSSSSSSITLLKDTLRVKITIAGVCTRESNQWADSKVRSVVSNVKRANGHQCCTKKHSRRPRLTHRKRQSGIAS